MSDDPYAPEDGRVDVSRVMAALREGIRRRREESFYQATPVEEIVVARLRALADEAQLEPELLSALLTGEGRFNLSPDYRIVTHRKGLEARLVVALKKLVRPLVRLYTDPIVHRQAQLNLYLLTVCEALLQEVTRLHQAVAALKERPEERR